MFEMNFSKFQVSTGNSSTIYSYKDVNIPANFYPDLPFIMRAILYRSKTNMNTFLLIVGNPRTSKSYCAIKLAEMYSDALGQKFDVEKQLTFDDIKKFLLWSQGAENSIFILDETGTTLNPDLFWSLQQRIMRRFVQTQGFRKNVLIWVLPSIIFLQKGFRFMTNYAIKTIKQGVAEVNKIKVDQLLGKGYPQYIETLSYTYPSKETEEKYIILKKLWNDDALKDDIDFMNKIESSRKHFTKPEILDMYKDEKINFDFAFNELIDIGYDPFRADLFLQQ